MDLHCSNNLYLYKSTALLILLLLIVLHKIKLNHSYKIRSFIMHFFVFMIYLICKVSRWPFWGVSRKLFKFWTLEGKGCSSSYHATEKIDS